MPQNAHKISIAYIVAAGCRHTASGVSTFIDTVHDAWELEYDCAFLEKPECNTFADTQRPILPHGGKAALGSRIGEHLPPQREHASVARVGLGYLRDLWHDVRWVWSVRKSLTNRVVVTNQFGCETLPVAIRIVRPFATLVAIAHTHPGVDARAFNPVRSMTERLCYLAVSDIIYNSCAVRAEWRKKLGRKVMKGKVICHGIGDPDLKKPDRNIETKPGIVNFVCVARFTPGKGHQELLRSWKAARVKGLRDAQLILVGDGPAMDESVKLSEREGITDSVQFLGARKDGARYFNSGDVGLLLATLPEAFGLVLLEAMSRGKPVIASRLGGIPEVVDDGKTGILVDPLSQDSIVDAILKLASSPEERERLGRAGQERWKAKFSAERMFENYREYFDSKVGRH